MPPVAEAQSGHAASALSLQTTRFSFSIQFTFKASFPPAMGVAYSVGE